MNLAEVCETAFRAGRTIDLSGCYHEITGPTAYQPSNYYPLLAGLARTQRMSQVLEIGTLYGGSILSVRKALAPSVRDPVLVTVDVKSRAEELEKYPDIVRIVGESLNHEVAERVIGLFRPPIDMIFVDSVHRYAHTKANLELYAAALEPRFVVLDDVHLNESMECMWGELVTEMDEDRIYDASELTGRGMDCGIGVIRWRTP